LSLNITSEKEFFLLSSLKTHPNLVSQLQLLIDLGTKFFQNLVNFIPDPFFGNLKFHTKFYVIFTYNIQARHSILTTHGIQEII
jgi:hypothetical protein